MKVLVLSFNHPEITSKTLNSVLQFCQPADILLVHNGSLPQHQLKLEKQFPEIEHLKLSENKGFSGGANTGLQYLFQKGTDWILFLTNDCQLIALGHAPESPSLSAPLIWRRKKGQIDSLGGKLNLSKAELRHCRDAKDFYLQEGQNLSYIPGTAFWIHRDIFQASQFDESLGTYWEDVDLSLRLAKAGHKLDLSPLTEVIHAVGKTCHKDMHYTTYLYQRNRKWVCLKHSQGSLVVRKNLLQSWMKTGFKLAINLDGKKMRLLYKAAITKN